MHSDIRDQKDERLNGCTVEQLETQSAPCILHPSISFQTQFRANQHHPVEGASFSFPLSLSLFLALPLSHSVARAYCTQGTRAVSILRISILNSNYSPLISRGPSLTFITIRTRLAPQNFVLALFVPVTYPDRKREERDLSWNLNAWCSAYGWPE